MTGGGIPVSWICRTRAARSVPAIGNRPSVPLDDEDGGPAVVGRASACRSPPAAAMGTRCGANNADTERRIEDPVTVSQQPRGPRLGRAGTDTPAAEPPELSS